MTFVIIVTIIIYLLVIAWSWNSLEDMEKPKKILMILLGFFIVYVLTQIVFLISKSGIAYENNEVEKSVGKVIIILFVGVNSLILPFVTKNFKKKENGEIGNNIFKGRMIIIGIIFLICLIIECGYMNDIQEGILSVYKSNMN